MFFKSFSIWGIKVPSKKALSSNTCPFKILIDDNISLPPSVKNKIGRLFLAAYNCGAKPAQNPLPTFTIYGDGIKPDQSYANVPPIAASDNFVYG